MWNKITGKSDSSSSPKDDRRRPTESTTHTKRAESVVSSSSARRPTRTDNDSRRAPTSSRNSHPPEAAPSVASSYATARDGASEYSTYDPMADRSPRPRGANDDLYDDPRDELPSPRRRHERTSSSDPRTSSHRDRSRSRDRDDKKRKEEKRDKRKSSRSERSNSISQTGGYRGGIVDSPKPLTRTFSDQVSRPGFTQFPGQDGAPMMSGGLPAPTGPPMSSHINDQFPGQNPVQFAAPNLPGPVAAEVFGAAADYYGDQGQSVHQQPGVRPQAPSVIMPLDTPHLMSASAQANPVEDTGTGAAADFYGSSNVDAAPSKPPRPSMPGAFEDEPAPPKPPRPSSKPSSSSKPSKPGKPGKLGSAATLAGGAALGYALGQNSTAHNSQSSNTYQSQSYMNGGQGASASMYMQGGNASTAATDGSYIPSYSEAMEGAPPPKPPRPGKPSKESSSHSNAGLYAAGAAGLAAYGMHHHSSHNHSSSMPGGFPGDQYGQGPSPSPFMSGGMATTREQKGPMNKLVDWWKDYEDVQKMEEYTEYIGVCRGCFDPRSSVQDAPRKHYYGRKRSGEFRPSGIGKQSRYSYSEAETKRKSKKSNWLAAGLGGYGLAKAGKALLNRDDFDDTYSIKSGHAAQSRTSLHRRSSRSRSRSRDRMHHSSGRSDVHHRSHSRDRMSRLSTGVTGGRKDHKIVRRRSRSRSRSHSRDRKSGILGAAIGADIAASAIGHAQRRRSRSRSRSQSPQKAFVHHRKDGSDYERRHSKSYRSGNRSSRSSLTSGSYVDISKSSRSQGGGFLGGFFSAPPPKQKRRASPSHLKKKKKKKGFFNFGNSSSSSSDSGLAFGAGYDRRRRRSSRRNSDEKFNTALVGLAATGAAIAATQAGRSKHGKHRPEVVAVRESRHKRKSTDRPRPIRSSYEEEDGWESLPEDDTSDSGSYSSGLAFGEYDWKKGKSTESLASSASGTSKWGWRWGSKKKKKPSMENINNVGSSTSLIGPAVAGTLIGAGLSRHDSNSSSAQTLQSVYPVQTDINSYDAVRRTSSVPTPQPPIIQQPQPMHQVPGSIYSTQAQSQPGYVVPMGPPVFANVPSQSSYSAQPQSAMIDFPKQHSAPPFPRRGNSSPTLSSWKRDAAIAGAAVGVGAAVVAASKSRDRRTSSPSNVRFDLTPDQFKKEERERQKEKERREEEDRRRREKQRKEDDARREEEERRLREGQRRQEEARRIEMERSARIETEQREADRRRERNERRAREAWELEETERQAREARETAEAERRAFEAAELERRAREARIEAQRKADLEREAEQMRRERREADIREDTERRQRERREAEIREDTERRERERQAQAAYERRSRDSDSERDRVPRRIEQQTTGSSIASDVRRKEKQLQERERDIVQPEPWKSTVAAATVAGAAAAITSAAISSHRTPSSATKTIVPAVKHVEPTNIVQDYADEEIFDPNIFKKRRTDEEVSRKAAAKVLDDWEDRYNEKPVSQADFFAPDELKNQSAPSPKIDPNEGAPDLHIFQAHDDFELGAPKVPPYPPSYSFKATRDGQGPSMLPYPVPVLNLIQPTPPGSRANSVRGVSVPPSPVIEPIEEPKKEEPKQPEANQRVSRVSWGQNQFHNYEVPTPESYRESWISDNDAKTASKKSKDSQDEIVVEVESPKSGTWRTSYRPEKEPSVSVWSAKEPESAPSTQYISEQDDFTFSDGPAKKMTKKEQKKAAKAAAAAAAALAAVAVAASQETKRDKSPPSPKDEPDTHSRSTAVQSTTPPTSNDFQAPFFGSASDTATCPPAQPHGFVEGEITEEPEPMTRVHMPGSFDDEQEPEPTTEVWAETPPRRKVRPRKIRRPLTKKSPSTIFPQVPKRKLCPNRSKSKMHRRNPSSS
ncbi:hypothetical protein BCR34DRAFT_199425 [Clohesyomyces aquaticus]|uniref:Involucrin repeat protein n=1 Tax=Clohesyomyces aquaticus TaxID=1231657 RepID=A0A1Y1YBF9_9PLEO|nr:hypothetical protein BCR34DRAFT_199425 [Clohesyomyces aquaticus]